MFEIYENVTKTVYISEKDQPRLRDIFSTIVQELMITEGVMWFEEDNTGEIQIDTYLFKELNEKIEELEEDMTLYNVDKEELKSIKELSETLEDLYFNKELDFITYR